MCPSSVFARVHNGAERTMKKEMKRCTRLIVSCFSLCAIGSCSEAVRNGVTTSETNRPEFPSRFISSHSAASSFESAEWILDFLFSFFLFFFLLFYLSLHRCVHCSRKMPDTRQWKVESGEGKNGLPFVYVSLHAKTEYAREKEKGKIDQPANPLD